MKLLLFSNSTNAGEEYLSYTISYIHSFIAEEKSALFVPFAGISIGFDSYFNRVREVLSALGLKLVSLHNQTNMVEAISQAQIIIVGGGNTFALLRALQDYNILHPIRDRIVQGAKYIGWSAGANLACPTIKTTNDMPITEPENFNSLNLIPFQINPHYTDFIQPGHAGETREMRIEEFLLMNHQTMVAGLREGTLFLIDDLHIELKGNRPCRIFKYGKNPLEVHPGENLDFLLQ
jgi:dipeptidase E